MCSPWNLGFSAFIPGAVQALLKGWQPVRAEENQQQATVRQEMVHELGVGSAMAPGLGSGVGSVIRG